MIGPCAKTKVQCVIVCQDGSYFRGENWCQNAQTSCPRKPGEDYTKCTTICRQFGHAEIDALTNLFKKEGDPVGATAYIQGHTHVCENCQKALFQAGVKNISVVKTYDELVNIVNETIQQHHTQLCST